MMDYKAYNPWAGPRRESKKSKNPRIIITEHALLIQQPAFALVWTSFTSGSSCITAICSLSQEDKYEQIVLIEADHCSAAFHVCFLQREFKKSSIKC